MTSVMPAWKQALIEKKRKKEQEEKAKTHVEEDRTASLPEWKKNLLARKKGLQGVDTNGLDKHSNIGNNNTVSGYDKFGQKRNSFTTNSTERECESNLGKSSPKVIIIPKASSQNGTQGAARQHSYVASSVPQSDQQKENKQIDQKLPRNGQEQINNQGIVPVDEENNSKVSYEHIKTPSELRKLFGIVSHDSVSFGTTSKESKKIQNQQTTAHRDVSTKPRRSSSTKDYEQSQKPTVNTHPQTYSRESMTMKEKEVELIHTPAKDEEEKENNVIIISRDNDTEISGHSEDDNRTKSVKDDEIPADVHVKIIRTKFGPSGNFRLHKSSSSDNLLNSKHQPVSPRSRGKPPPLNKRWSADVGGILSPTRSTSEDEDIFDSVHNDIQVKRMRSKSMGDVSRMPEDHQFHDMEPVVNLKHRASISSGIERRLQVLLHNLSVSDGKNDEIDDVENINICLDQNVNDHFHDDSNKTTSSGGSSGKQVDEDDLPPKIRKASWYNPEDDIKDTRLMLTHQDYDLHDKPAVKSTILPSSGHDLNKSSNAQQKIKAKHYDIGRNEVAIDSKGKQVHNIEKFSSNQESSVPLRPLPQKTMVMNGRISHEPVNDESEKDEKPPKGSVHKLSSIFGSSISKGNKKDKKAKAKTDNNDQLLNQENISKTQKKDSQKSSSSRIFPWSKKQKKSEPVKVVKGEQIKPFSGASSLRPVQQKVVEQKITGNMTLVLNANAGSYEPKSKPKQPKLDSANQAPGMGHLNSLSGQDSQLKRKDENKLSLGVRKPDDMMVTVIDVPDPSSSNDVEVSAIDLPEPPSPTPVSVIDIPESPEHDVKVSVIDMPDDEVDSDDSDSSSTGMSGSYDINPTIESIEEEEEEEEEEEDIDNVPVSYFGDSTYMKVPEVIFESKVENVKSCLSSPLRSRKTKAKVVFHDSNLIKVHDYPSEGCLQYHYDQYSKENGGKTIDQYRPSSLQGVEQNARPRQQEEKEPKDKTKVFKLSDNTELKDNNNAAPTITYLDQGEAFTSSSSSGALLF